MAAERRKHEQKHTLYSMVDNDIDASSTHIIIILHVLWITYEIQTQSVCVVIY